MVELGGWFKEKFWTGAGTDGRISTKLITRQLESYLPSDPAGVPYQLPGRRATARTRKAPASDLPWYGGPPGLPHGGSTRYLWGFNSVATAIRGRVAGGAGTAGSSGRLSPCFPGEEAW
jgi:hypothetical protein